MNQFLIFFITLPLVAFFISLFFQNKHEKSLANLVHFATLGYILAAVGTAIVWAVGGFQDVHTRIFTFYKTAGFEFSIQLFYDRLTAVYSLVGSLIFFLVATFSRYYMHRDEGFGRFFSTLLFFMSGYNLIVFSGNFETLFIGWEVIGLASFLLIAFYRNRYLPVKNAFKTISIYRVSDVALILAMWMMHHLTHQNISFTQLSEAKSIATESGHFSMAVFIMLMIFLAAVAKSAQLPFTSWLPRAMEGPTSSSAIFYGSLSVHIGVFVLIRTYPFWNEMTGIKIAIISIGALTGIIASLIARVQPTVKTQIAYASAAQIGIIFIEVALGWHVLALVHFAGNAFLRTYQLLVSPSVLNYLVHHQYFNYKPHVSRGNNLIANSIYTLSVKEWNLDRLLYRLLWSPFKHAGMLFRFLESRVMQFLVALIGAGLLYVVLSNEFASSGIQSYLSILSLGIALALILYSFASRQSAAVAWGYLLCAHVFIIAAVLNNIDELHVKQLAMYASGILISGLLGFFSLEKIRRIDNDISLANYHGYVYEQRNTALLFLLSAIGLLGFPVTAAFIGIDVFFTHIGGSQVWLITLLALCFVFIELAAIRIYCRIFLGLHKKLNHPVAYRSS